MKIEILYDILPLYGMIAEDEVFDEAYTYKGFVFVFSLILLPITLPLFLIGKLITKIEGRI